MPQCWKSARAMAWVVEAGCRLVLAVWRLVKRADRIEFQTYRHAGKGMRPHDALDDVHDRDDLMERRAAARGHSLRCRKK